MRGCVWAMWSLYNLRRHKLSGLLLLSMGCKFAQMTNQEMLHPFNRLDYSFVVILCRTTQWCGQSADYCGTCCQNGPCSNPPSSPPPPPSPPTGFNYNVDHGEDSRLIAYLGNWQPCPTPTTFDAYSHVVIAFVVTYTWDWSKNFCDMQCNIPPALSICNNANNQGLIDQMRAAGKKVILSFGGAGMGGSWSGMS